MGNRHEEARSSYHERFEKNFDGGGDVLHCFCGRVRAEAERPEAAAAEGGKPES